MGGVRMRSGGCAGLLLLGLLLFACQSPGPEIGPPSPGNAEIRVTATPTDPTRFSGVRAWGHLAALEEIGPRVSGGKGAERARAYLRDELGALGLEVRELPVEVAPAGGGEVLELVHLVAVLPGESPDVFLLAAHYDTLHYESFRYVGTNESASGPALLLELARVMSLETRPYTVWLAFIDGDALDGVALEREALEHGALDGVALEREALEHGALDGVALEREALERDVALAALADGGDAEAASGLLGSRSFASALAAEDELAGIRLAVVFDAVADSDLHIARDLNSRRVYRETFWEVAHDLDRSTAFPMDGSLDSPQAAHRSFAVHGVRSIVAIVDNRYGGDAIPGDYWHTEHDTSSHCSPRSLQTVGEVSFEALSRIAERLSRIDDFATHPLEGVNGVPAPARIR